MRYHPFDSLVQLHARHIRLDCATLHLAKDYYPYLNISRYVHRLDALAEEVAHLRPGLTATSRYEALREVLVENHELNGNNADYYDPQNSYLNRVLDRGLGIPISLSVIWIEVARRLKWPVAGVGVPGHFLVRIDDPDQFVIADPFRDGRSLSVDDCQKLVASSAGRPVRFSRKMLRPLGTRPILARILRNLRSLYLSRADWQHLARILERLAALEPRNARHLQDLAAVHTRLGDVRGAYSYLRVYLDREPDASDRDIIRDNLERLEAAIVALN